MSVCTYGCQSVPMGVLGCQMLSEGAYWCLTVATGVCGFLLLSEGAY